MRKLVALADRTAVLFLGVAAGAAIGFAFGRSDEPPRARPAAMPGRIAAAAPAPSVVRAAAAGFECALPFQQHLLDTVTAGRPVTVGVFGDSFGDGVWSALYRLLPAQEHFRVLKYSQQSTGFTRYASLNLEEHAQAQLAADGPVDVAVISFGANDTQGVYAGGHAAALMSPEWQRVIGERVDRFVALMRARGAMVYWVGLPKMRKASFDDDISAMNDFYTAKMKALRVPFIDIKPLTVDDAGEFALYLADPVSHERRLLRANDGVHMSMNGYVVITRGLADRIRAYVRAAKVMAGVGEAAPVAAGPVRAAVPPARPTGQPPEPAKPDADHARHRPARDKDQTSTRSHREDGDEDKAVRVKHGDGDKPPEEHDGDVKARAPKSTGDTKPGSGETRPDEAKPGEPKSSEKKSSEKKSSEKKSGEGKRQEHEDQPSETRNRSGEAKPHPGEAKPRSHDAKAKSGEGKQRSGDAPAKPRKHRDENPSPEAGNSQ